MRPIARSRSPNRTPYGYRKDQRYFADNVFREIDRPGEWYLDRRAERSIGFRQGVNPGNGGLRVSVLAEPFVVLENVSHVMLLGLTIQEGRGDGIHMQGGTNCLIAGCTLRRLGGDAVVVRSGRHHGIFGWAMTRWAAARSACMAEIARPSRRGTLCRELHGVGRLAAETDVHAGRATGRLRQPSGP